MKRSKIEKLEAKLEAKGLTEPMPVVIPLSQVLQPPVMVKVRSKGPQAISSRQNISLRSVIKKGR